MEVTIKDLLAECKTSGEWRDLVLEVIRSADTPEDLDWIRLSASGNRCPNCNTRVHGPIVCFCTAGCSLEFYRKQKATNPVTRYSIGE